MKKKIIKEISVFFPAYNEEKNIIDTVLNAKKVLDKIANKYEIIIINDGSTDKTLENSNKLAKKYHNIKVINHEKNKGYGAALISGFYACKYPWIAYTDSDKQHDFSEITHFIELQKKTNADIVMGYYKERKVPAYRKIYSLLWQTLIKFIFNVSAKDIGCAFKLIRKDVIENIPKFECEKGNLICTEFLYKSNKSGFKMIEIPITHYPRIHGKTRATNLKGIINSFISLIKLGKKIRCSK